MCKKTIVRIWNFHISSQEIYMYIPKIYFWETKYLFIPFAIAQWPSDHTEVHDLEVTKSLKLFLLLASLNLTNSLSQQGSLKELFIWVLSWLLVTKCFKVQLKKWFISPIHSRVHHPEGVCHSGKVHRGRESVTATVGSSWSHCIYIQEVERHEGWCSASLSSFFIVQYSSS